MGIYFVFMIIFVILSDFRLSNRVSLEISTILLIILSGFRYYVGVDYDTYEAIYNWMGRGLADFQIEKSPLFAWIMQVAIKENLGYQFVVFISSAVFLLGFRCFIKNLVPSRYWMLSYFLLFSSHLIFLSFNIYRQTFALGISLFGFIYFKKKKKIWAVVIFQLIAFGIHSISLVFVLVYVFWFILNKSKKYNFLIVIYLLSILFMFINPVDIIQTLFGGFMGRYANYFGTSKMDRNMFSIFKQIVPNFLFLVYFNFFKNNKNCTREDRAILAGFFLNIIFSNIGVGIELIIRISSLFLPFYIVGSINSLLILNKPYRSYAYWGFVVYGFILVVWVGITNGYGVANYNWVLW